MTNTPKHIVQLQLKLWLAKPPGERLLQFITNNETMLNGINKAKEKLNISGKKHGADNLLQHKQ